jgi:hypothetical protein
MTIPGFGAEASIYQSTATYFSGSFGSSADGIAVVPQLKASGLIASGDYWNCMGEHGEAGFDVGLSDFFCRGQQGGGGGRPNLACISCKLKCNAKPVAQQAACRQQCEDVC